MSALPGVEPRSLYLGVVALVAAERLVELFVSRRNERRLRARGAQEAGAGHYPVMVALHATFLAACPLEVWLLDRPFLPALAAAAALTLVAATALRWWVIAALKGRWTTRVLVLPGTSPVTGGPYRFLRHPNYLAVVLELLALPLLHSAWLAAALFSAANAALLRVRIRSEEAALSAASDWATRFAGRARLLPFRNRR